VGVKEKFLMEDFFIRIDAGGLVINTVFSCLTDTRRNNGECAMKRNDYYNEQHKKNLKTFWELAKRISKGFLKIMDIRIDEPEFGHQRVVIFLHDEEQNG
jgi:hypothetical protein